ncbi:MAG: hypothetical protein WAO69_00855 [Aestuariivita sp.]|uniref:hypothetical protein n=1 Tax=Aestuariivita sp. TaxID=1872407 RepID=UPI003BB2028B
MHFQRVLSAAVAATLLTALPGLAMDAKVYPYHAKHNFCPAGLQPVTISGAICCGTPNQSHSYQSMMAHPTPKRVSTRQYDCPPGTKGCN